MRTNGMSVVPIRLCGMAVETESISVCTITAGRDEHLRNQINGMQENADGAKLPFGEHIVVFMGQEERPWDETPPLVREVQQEGGIELARARNRAASEARGDVLVFLDVDVIPEPGAIEKLANEAAEHDALVMADPHYLSPEWTPDLDPAADGVPHPAREDVPVGQSERYEMFWSLGFAITRDAFERIGGFDESYVGYGAEDTDFAFAARKAGVPFWQSDARVFHQAHAVVKPPLHHAESIVENANRFAAKWGELPMRGWLDRFAETGIVAINEVTQRVRFLRKPGALEILGATDIRARF